MESWGGDPVRDEEGGREGGERREIGASIIATVVGDLLGHLAAL